MPSPHYLLPLPEGADKLPSNLAMALRDVEQQFDISTDKLKEITKQMLWEYSKGLSELPTDETRDTFVCVTLLPAFPLVTSDFARVRKRSQQALTLSTAGP